MSSPASLDDAVAHLPRTCRLMLCLGGNQPRGQQLASALGEHPLMEVVSRPLTLAALVERLQQQPVDLVLLAGHLRGVDDYLPTLLGAGPPLLVLDREPAHPRWQVHGRLTTLPLDATTETILQTMLALHEGSELPIDAQAALLPTWRSTLQSGPSSAPPTQSGHVIALLGVGGSGASTIAVETAALLSLNHPTALVDLDLLRPSLLLYLGRPLAHNINTIAQDNPQTPAEWETTLAREVARCEAPLERLAVVNGLPHLEARGQISPAFVQRLSEALIARYRYVVFDVGSDLVSTDSAARAHAQALRLADKIILVVQPDYHAGWRMRHLLAHLTETLHLPAERLTIVANGLGAGSTISSEELSDEFGPIAACIPFDRARLLSARRQGRPLVVAAPGPAERALRRLTADLAEQCGTPLARPTRRWWQWRPTRSAAQPQTSPIARQQPKGDHADR